MKGVALTWLAYLPAGNPHDGEKNCFLDSKIKDSLIRQGMQNRRSLHREGPAERVEKERILLSDRAHKS